MLSRKEELERKKARLQAMRDEKKKKEEQRKKEVQDQTSGIVNFRVRHVKNFSEEF